MPDPSEFGLSNGDALRNLGSLSPPSSVNFLNPVIIVVYPTNLKGLEPEMEETFLELGISALAINEDTRSCSCSPSKLVGQGGVDVSMLLLSPEQLSLRSFDHLLQKKAFSERVTALGCSWYLIGGMQVFMRQI